ncbi:MAG: hypothetical protein J6S34_03690, partial [Clostridia bacterium]|nr:hypothetical protein [Clostridia bacterium]
LSPTLSLGTVLTVSSALLVFVLLFVRGTFGKFGLLFMAIAIMAALSSELLSRLVFLKKGAKSKKKVRKSRKKVRKTP